MLNPRPTALSVTIRSLEAAASLAIAIAAGSFAAPARAADPPAADRIWIGRVLTMVDASMRAEAVAVKDGRIVAVGSAADVAAHRGPSTVVTELGDRALLPGFVDAHGHVVLGGLQALSANLLPPPDGTVEDIASLQRAMRDWVSANRATVDQLGVIIGFGYDPAQLREQRHPTRQELDAVSESVPVVAVHQSGHLSALNGKALSVAGITPDTPNPPGGVIRREADGRTPDGVLEEIASIQALIKVLSSIPSERAPAFVTAGIDLWARYGYTTAQDGRTTPGLLALLRRVADADGLRIDVASYPDVLIDRDLIKRSASRSYSRRLRVAGAKLTIDGSPQGFTAWRDRPYYRPVGDYPPGYRGYSAATPEQVNDAVAWAYANDIQLLTHANGEAAIDQLLAAVRAAAAAHPGGDRRSVLVHGQFMREDQVDAARELGVMPSLFPMHTYYWGDWHREHTVGPRRADDISPTGWCVDRGMRFTTHHDAPVAFPDSMRVLAATVTRRSRSGDILGPWQRVDVLTALKAMTIWAAWQHFEEASKGSIEVGKLADLVVLSADPTAVDPDALHGLKVMETVKEGTTVFELTPEAARKAALMSRPGRDGTDPFANFLVAAAIARDLEALPPEVRLRPAVQRAMQAGRGGPHDAACVLRALDGMAEAIGAVSPRPPGG